MSAGGRGEERRKKTVEARRRKGTDGVVEARIWEEVEEERDKGRY